MTTDDRFGTAMPIGARSPEYEDGLTVQDVSDSAQPTATAPADHTGRAFDHDHTRAVDRALISADKVVGTAVYDAVGERLGTVDSIMVDKGSGQVKYAVMSFGGFLGIGERFHPLPWDALSYDEAKGGFNIQHTADDLRKAPNYSRSEVDTFDYSRNGAAIDDYYGVGIPHGDAIGSTTGAGSTGLGSGMAANRSF